jgi:hypothetical protein
MSENGEIDMGPVPGEVRKASQRRSNGIGM